VPGGPLWVHEIKHDGYRMVCRRDGDRVRVFTRRGHDWTDRVPKIAEALRCLRVTSATLDGEAVVCDDRGLSDFDRLRSALARRGSREAFLYAFDLLEIDGRDLRRGPYGARPWRASCAGPPMESGCPSTSTAPTARRSSATLAPSDLKALSRSAAIGPIAPGDRPIGSRSRTRTHRRRRG
jgi:hypothetical protein